MGLFSRLRANDQPEENEAQEPAVQPEETVVPERAAEPEPEREAISEQIVVVDVMPKPEILDPQGKAVGNSLVRLGFDGLTVRQGKRFEITVEGEITEERLDQIAKAAETLLANTVIESFEVRVEDIK